MKTTRSGILIIFFTLFCKTINCQDGIQFSQVVKIIEFVNPAYNFSKATPNATAIYRNQWMGLEGAPKTMGFNLHYPMQYQNFGLGINIINQNIGLRNLTTAGFNFDVGIQNTKNSYISMGLQGGIKQMAYLKDKAISSVNYEINNIKDLTSPYIGAGLMYFTKKLQVGGSGFAVFYNDENYSFVKQITFNIHASYYMNLRRNFSLKPIALYKQNTINISAFDLGLYFLYKDKIWIGGTYRINEALSFLLDVKVTKNIRIGYSYDFSLLKSKRLTTNSSEIRLDISFEHFNKNKYYQKRQELDQQ